jgi:hypothetical protein
MSERKSLFGFGASASQPTSTQSTTPSEFIPDDSQQLSTDSSFAPEPSSSPSSLPSEAPSVSNVVSAATSSPLFTPQIKLALHPIAPEEKKVEYLFINQHPLAPKEKPTGKFGPIPMRDGTDKLLYGTGIAYGLGRLTSTEMISYRSCNHWVNSDKLYYCHGASTFGTGSFIQVCRTVLCTVLSEVFKSHKATPSRSE